MMRKGNVNGPLKLFTENMSTRILPLNDKTLNMLQQKYPKANEPPQEVLILNEDMDEPLILKAVMPTKGRSGPSGLDADTWRKILKSRSFATASSDLRTRFALFFKRLCLEEIISRISRVIQFMQIDPYR